MKKSNKKRSSRSTKVVAILLWVALILLLSMEWDGEKKTAVKTVPVVRGDLEVWVSSTGKVRSRVQVEVKSKAGGEIKSIEVEEGDYVEEGDLLVRIDPRTEESGQRKARSRLNASRAGYSSARSARKLAEKQLKRGQELADEGFISAESLDRMKTEARLARDTQRAAAAEVALAREEYERAQELLDDTRVAAPISGTVLVKYVEEGQIISSGLNAVTGGTPLILLADLSDPEIVAQVDESDVGSIAVGREARITADAFPGVTFAGEVERIAPMGTAQSNITGFAVTVRLHEHPERGRLRPGMTADVEILSRKLGAAVLVPAAAIRNYRGEVGVWVQGEEEASFRPVGLGATDGFTVEVLSGLSPGERIITGRTPVEDDETARSKRRGCGGPGRR